MIGLGRILAESLARDEPAILVTVAAARGSTPREVGARMLVAAGWAVGTVGGGRLEFAAIDAARRMIRGGTASATIDAPLGAAMGQCCGGHVVLRLERGMDETLARLDRIDAEERATWPYVYVFGAGHVGRALADALGRLPLRLCWVDERPEEFPVGIAANVTRLISRNPTDLIADAPPGASYLILTHSHALDFELMERVLERGDFAYAGLIGSMTKRRRFERWYVARGHGAGDLERLVCPIGAGLHREKRPAVIAAMVAAELLLAQDAAIATALQRGESLPNAKAAFSSGIASLHKTSPLEGEVGNAKR